MAARSSNHKVNTRPKKQQTTLQTTCWTKPISLTKTMIYLQNYATHHVSVLILKTRHKTCISLQMTKSSLHWRSCQQYRLKQNTNAFCCNCKHRHCFLLIAAVSVIMVILFNHKANLSVRNLIQI